MGEIFRSLKDWWKERAASPFWGVYFFAFVFWNWRIIYTLFWQDIKFLNQPSIEYVEQHIFFFQGVDARGRFFALFGNEFLAVAVPAFITWVLIQIMPFIHAWACRIKEHSNFELLAIKDEEKGIYERKKEDYLKEVQKSKVRQKETTKNIQKNEKQIRANLTEEEKWEVEFLESEKTLSDNGFSIILNAIYDKKGHIYDGNVLLVGKTALAFVDSLGLIKFEGASRGQITLTEKGKYFAKKFLKEHRLY